LEDDVVGLTMAVEVIERAEEAAARVEEETARVEEGTTTGAEEVAGAEVAVPALEDQLGPNWREACAAEGRGKRRGRKL
jgi:hypothetical protein